LPVYSLDFSENLIRAAQAVNDNGDDSVDAMRTVLYLSLLSCEISLKALLEKAGMPITEIRNRSHNLERLLMDLGRCEVEEEVANGVRKWVPAMRIRSKVITINEAQLTIGDFLEGESQGASRYPNEVRYGEHLYHYPPEASLNAASTILHWAREKWDIIRFP